MSPINPSVIDLGLPPLTSPQAPGFADTSACRDWLAGLPLTNIGQAQTQLLRQINLLNGYPLPVGTRLEILELLRTPIDFILEQSAKHYAGRPLPLSEAGQAAFDASLTLWQALETGYLHCLQASLDGAADLTEPPHRHAALAAMRALSALLAIHLVHSRAGILPAPVFWRRLHLIYRAAEELKISQLPVEDSLRRKTTPAALYAQVLLLEAAYPAELGSRQLALVADWAQRWSGKVDILRQPPDDPRTPALCVDLAGTQAAAFHASHADSAELRWLELSGLRKSIKKRLVLLEQGERPETLNLGKGCVQPACGVLLKQVYRYWCKGGRRHGDETSRAAPRGREGCQLVAGIEAIHYHLSGQVFRKAEQSVYLSRREHEEIATFGRIATHFDAGKNQAHDFMLEEWRLLDETAAELHLERSLKQPGGRLSGNQLVAVRQSGSEGFLLGVLRWVTMSGGRDSLLACVRLLPGAPVAAALRNSASKPAANSAQYHQGLCLPAVEELGEVASVLAPAGWFSPAKTIEAQTDCLRKMRLNRLLERGTDFERIAFEWL
ncbi:MAG: hypothetical protein HY066_16965 [Betaproteobacteria bacterium]|nr:hypothetical protein [Betaproteobacteria bacterium]